MVAYTWLAGSLIMTKHCVYAAVYLKLAVLHMCAMMFPHQLTYKIYEDDLSIKKQTDCCAPVSKPNAPTDNKSCSIPVSEDADGEGGRSGTGWLRNISL